MKYTYLWRNVGIIVKNMRKECLIIIGLSKFCLVGNGCLGSINKWMNELNYLIKYLMRETRKKPVRRKSQFKIIIY